MNRPLVSAALLAIYLLPLYVNAEQLLDPVKVARQQGSTKPPPCAMCRLVSNTVKKVKFIDYVAKCRKNSE